ncbi:MULTISPECIES: nuclear transport factor 2 family protein [Gordonia]|uniref:Nuclear transport factor 2 family protein n=1 Tax=Gordonia hongkongensis TaxID=1701090 RepID=A0ABT6BS61_9ACTN|nr:MULTISPECIES: nuclear transport factor 2 family protein [Gordonia]MDF6100844.1 nuclear transport factor 2 family protein [Gordonia hongkongensis]
MTSSRDPSAERIAAARAYVDALVSHDPSAVALHPDCTRVEFGVRTGRDGDHIARSLARGPQFRLIHRISDFTATVDGHSVTTRYVVHVRPKTLRLGATVSETFVVDEDNRIRAIVAHFGLPRPQRA